ncbi:MAG: hypothetical protein ACP5NL_01885 [Thermoplasmata archaeon]
MNNGLVERALRETMLIERHIEILNLVHKEGPIGIMKISEMLKIPTHKVRYSLRIIEKEGLIAASIDGATVTYKVPEELNNIDKELDNLIEIIKEIKLKIKSY